MAPSVSCNLRTSTCYVLKFAHVPSGVVSWNAPTTDDITASAAALSRALTASMKAFILDPHASFTHAFEGRVDVGMWTVGARTLVLATNLNYAQAEFDLHSVGLNALGAVQVLDSGASLSGHTITLESVGTGAFILG